MLPLRWTERAVDNLADIADFISQHSAFYAEGVVTRIDHQLQLLRIHPELGKPAPEASDLGVRELVVDSFRVFYRVHAECVEVLAIIHSRRQLPGDLR